MLGKFKSGQSRIPPNRTSSLEAQAGYDHYQATAILKPSKKLIANTSFTTKCIPPDKQEKFAKKTHKIAPDKQVLKTGSQSTQRPQVPQRPMEMQQNRENQQNREIQQNRENQQNQKISQNHVTMKHQINSKHSISPPSPHSPDNTSSRGRSAASSGYSTHSITSSSPAISSSDDEEGRKLRSKSSGPVERNSSSDGGNKQQRYESKSSERALKPERKEVTPQEHQPSTKNSKTQKTPSKTNKTADVTVREGQKLSSDTDSGVKDDIKRGKSHPPELPPKKSTTLPDKKIYKNNENKSENFEKVGKNKKIELKNFSKHENDKRNSVSSETDLKVKPEQTAENGENQEGEGGPETTDSARLKQILMSIEPGDLYHFTIARLNTQDPKIIDALRVLLPAIDVEKLAQLSTSTFNTSGSSGAGSTNGSRGATSSSNSTSGDGCSNDETSSQNSNETNEENISTDTNHEPNNEHKNTIPDSSIKNNSEIRDLMTDKNMKNKENQKNHKKITSTGSSTDDVSSNCGASEASSKAPLSSLDFEEEEVGSVGECNDPSDETKPPAHHEIPENTNPVYCAEVHYSNNMKTILSASKDCKVYMAEVRSNGKDSRDSGKDSGKSHTDSISTHSLISIVPKSQKSRQSSENSDKYENSGNYENSRKYENQGKFQNSEKFQNSPTNQLKPTTNTKSLDTSNKKQVQHCVRCHKNFDANAIDDEDLSSSSSCHTTHDQVSLTEEQKCKVSHPENMVIKLVEDKSGCDFKCMVCSKEFRLKVGYYEECQNPESVVGSCLASTHTADPANVKFRKCGGAAKTCEENGCVEFYV
jgi:hypothetical protein